MMENTSHNKKRITFAFAVVLFFAGFLFVDRGSISGNVIFDGSYSVSIFSVIGLILVLCSVVLAVYSIKKR